MATSILDACTPRPDILSGGFDPSTFTASLQQVLDAYRGKDTGSASLYTDAEVFFREGTYPTEGLKAVLRDMFGRLSGDRSYPFSRRLETAFGGGKTHALIALTHLGHRGNALAPLVQDLLDPALLPAPGEVKVVAIAGDALSVQKPVGTELRAYTLWGEIALQVGGEGLYRELAPLLASSAAPASGDGYFERVFDGRKVLLLIDELAQYAARLDAAQPGGSKQLAAFFMALYNYARQRAGLAVVVTLASLANTFADETKSLAAALSAVSGREVSPSEAVAQSERVRKENLDVINRDSEGTVPVQSSELSRVLSRRLFARIDSQAAREVAQEYTALYRQTTHTLPEQVTRADYASVLEAYYPFHPTFVAYLTGKLSLVESFQGTRGVLRVMSLVIRQLWEARQPVAMIHTCHLDTRTDRIVTEVLGRTGNNDLRPPLQADVGDVRTTGVSSTSVAERLDRSNPHPLGFPLHEWVWRTVFLHSLAGRGGGLNNRFFGIGFEDALLAVAQPGLPPAQVDSALGAIRTKAYFLREQDGRFYADTEPTLNRIRDQIRETLPRQQIVERIQQLTTGLKGEPLAETVTRIQEPGDIADRPKLTLGVVDFAAETVDPTAIVQHAATGPRSHQNQVLLLVPFTVQVAGETWNTDRTHKVKQELVRLHDLAGQALAGERLVARHQEYGVNATTLRFREFQNEVKGDALALTTAVIQNYNRVYFPSPAARGEVIGRDLAVGQTGAGGEAIGNEIARVLGEAGKLVRADQATTRETLLSLGKRFFTVDEVPEVKKLQALFTSRRDFPLLESPGMFEAIIREGVTQGLWCLLRMDDPSSIRPEVLHDRETPPPMHTDLGTGRWFIATPSAVTRRGWKQEKRPDPVTVATWMAEAMRGQGDEPISLQELGQRIVQKHGDLNDEELLAGANTYFRDGRVCAFRGEAPADGGRPTQMAEPKDLGYTVSLDDQVITPAAAVRRGWIGTDPDITPPQVMRFESEASSQFLLQQFARLGSLYNRGKARSEINLLDVVIPLPSGGDLTFTVSRATPDDMKELAEVLEAFSELVKTAKASARLYVEEPPEDCELVQQLRQQQEN